jgi:hypothetical protein
MEDLEAGDLKIKIRTAPAAGAPIQLYWTGKSNDRQPDRTLAPFFRTMLEQAAAQHRTVEMHFEQIAHFNSSTVTVIIQIIQEAKQKGVNLELVYDSHLKWQKLSFDALEVVARRHGHVRLRSA